MSNPESHDNDVAATESQTAAEVAVRRFHGGDAEIALLEFQGELKDQIVANLHGGFLSTETHASGARAVSPQSMKSLVVSGSAAGATALSAGLSSTLFVATANPSTLMQIGAGFGSAQVGAGGILAQAPFIPVASSLPVVAPMLAVQAISTAIILKEFEKVDQKLDVIKGAVDTAIARFEATHAGQLLAASAIVDEIHQQYELSGAFSNDMLIRLSLAERDVFQLAERFRHLALTSQIPTSMDDPGHVQRANYDAHSAMLSSFLSLRIAHLRLCVDMQENPKSVEASVERLTKKIREDSQFWEYLLQRSESLRDEITIREEKLSDMNWAERALPGFAGGRGTATQREIEALKAAYVSTLESENAIMKGFTSLIETAKETLVVLENPKKNLESAPTLVYWQDETGEHSFATDRLQLS
ncbi:hypothetical protein [Agrococcus casei]|uniref:Uncharacterized protein n=1 Tax=Agrococcus casei LMG 22410 TaxID=1255656 RepID=A0A1R4GAZ5_9MICO|nr:hypothetical protein [Agrococcus casei]SJM65361.1 hypothetical protein CZ674_10435 [Agrococcus casei LMG 22410]